MIMGAIEVIHRGSFSNLDKFLSRVSGGQHILRVLDKYGRKGVEALAAATPKDSGLTAASWSYEYTSTGDLITITWTNSNVKKGYFNVAMMLQLGHGTGTGGYVTGIDYINPALRPVFDRLADDAWTEVVNS